MKMSDFVSSHIGKSYDLDGAYGAQCVDGLNAYLVWGGKSRISHGNAWDIGAGWQSNGLSGYCTQVAFSNIRDGDICFWNYYGVLNGHVYGHVAMYYQGKYFGQNQGTTGNGGPFNLMALGTPSLILRPNFITTLSWVIPSENRSLSTSEMQNNAKCFYGYMNKVHGWSLNACAGVLGNMQVESSINPNRHEVGGGSGFGLVQWTPGSKCTNYLNSRGAKLSDYGNMECDLIATGSGWYSTNSYSISWNEFIHSSRSANWLALAYLANFERPANPNQPLRGTYADNWANYLSSWSPEVPDGASDAVTVRSQITLKVINGVIYDMFISSYVTG